MLLQLIHHVMKIRLRSDSEIKRQKNDPHFIYLDWLVYLLHI